MFKCDKCGNNLILDYKNTSAYYNDNVTTLLDEDGAILYDKLPDEVVYVCHRCGERKLIDINSIILDIKEKVCKILLGMRLDITYKFADKSLVDEASGVSFCGRCRGVVDGSGYCYNDVIKQCPVRKILDDKEHTTKRGEYKE
jgi:DNA-directed RNA polymerase subunit RPC12/RpoP